MLYKIKAVPNSRNPSVDEEGDVLRVKIDEQPIGGRANQRLLEILSEYFNIPKNFIRIVSGRFSRNKVIEIIKK